MQPSLGGQVRLDSRSDVFLNLFPCFGKSTHAFMRHYISCFTQPHSPLNGVDGSGGGGELLYRGSAAGEPVARPFMVHANGRRKKPFLFHPKLLPFTNHSRLVVPTEAMLRHPVLLFGATGPRWSGQLCQVVPLGEFIGRRG